MGSQVRTVRGITSTQKCFQQPLPFSSYLLLYWQTSNAVCATTCSSLPKGDLRSSTQDTWENGSRCKHMMGGRSTSVQALMDSGRLWTAFRTNGSLAEAATT